VFYAGLICLCLVPVAPSFAQRDFARTPAQTTGLFHQFRLPVAWQEHFWATTGAQKLLELEPAELARLVPEQAGLRWVRCPACNAPENLETIVWTPEKPGVATCSKCNVSVPSDQFPAKVPPAPGQPPVVLEELVEVAPRLLHHYPYHVVVPEHQKFPEERLYLAARRDYAAREYLLKAALYAADRWRSQSPDARDNRLATLAATILVRYAQVYPNYATHTDQPGHLPSFQAARVRPPFRAGYVMAKGDWLGCLDVPIPLVLAWAYLSGDPAIEAAGRLLGEPDPRHTVEQSLFEASAAFVAAQPEETSEPALLATRGLLFVAALLDNEPLWSLATQRTAKLLDQGFYHDGVWHEADREAQKRVVGLLDGWILPLLDVREQQEPSLAGRPIVRLARCALDPDDPLDLLSKDGLQIVSWPPVPVSVGNRQPKLFGGAGLAEFHMGTGSNGLLLRFSGRGEASGETPSRLTFELEVGGRPVLGGVQDRTNRPTASFNSVMIDGLNQRESFERLRDPCPGANLLFFTADSDFQVACFDDRLAYPTRAKRYRATVVVLEDALGPCAIRVFEVSGGVQHDLLLHADSRLEGRWHVPLEMRAGSESLLSSSIPFVPHARADYSRWLVQGLGAIKHLEQANLQQPVWATLADHTRHGVRVHLLGDLPMTLARGIWQDFDHRGDETEGRSVLVQRRVSADGRDLDTRFVDVFEPLATPHGQSRRVARVESPGALTIVLFDDRTSLNYLAINATPGQSTSAVLPDGRLLRTDALAVLVRPNSLIMAGGSFAECARQRVDAAVLGGRVVASGRNEGAGAPGWFELEGAGADVAAMRGRTLVIKHDDGTSRAWTVADASPTAGNRIRIAVREEPGFRIEPATGDAVYYQYPLTRHHGPHLARLCSTSRAVNQAP
jgi:hypothetical protein